MIEEPMISPEEVLKEYTLDELDELNYYIGVGSWWKSSARRRELKSVIDSRPKDWCFVDDCPHYICDGPHRNVLTDLGMERLRGDQKPIGKRI